MTEQSTLHTRLEAWLHSNNTSVQTVAGMTLPQMQRAARSLSVPLRDVVAARAMMLLPVAAMMVSTACTTTTAAGNNNVKNAGGGGNDDAMTTYFNSGYSYFDAEETMKLFKLGSVEEAKALLGREFSKDGGASLAKSGITTAPYDRHEMWAAFNSSGYTYEDCKILQSKTDFLKSPDDACEYIGLKFINGVPGVLVDMGLPPPKK